MCVICDSKCVLLFRNFVEAYHTHLWSSLSNDGMIYGKKYLLATLGIEPFFSMMVVVVVIFQKSISNSGGTAAPFTSWPGEKNDFFGRLFRCMCPFCGTQLSRVDTPWFQVCVC